MNVPSFVPKYDTFSRKTAEYFTWTKHGSGLINDVLKTNGYKMLHIFGNSDAATTLLGTTRWIKSLKWKKTETQRPWYFTDPTNFESFVGYINSWDNYQIATMLGQGHSGMFVKANETRTLVYDFVKNLKI